jgi:mono/diheme cytochrome c family protein
MVTLLLTVTLGSIAILAGQPQTPAAKPDPAAVERGKYLVTIAVCNDCHTPFKMGPNGPEPDMSRMLSGHPEGLEMPPPPTLPAGWGFIGSETNTAWAGPWGISYTANLTPDRNTGIGIWTEDMFIKALRTGRHMGASRPINPPMPWPWYGKMTDADLKAVFAYLRTIPPIKNRVPDYIPPK